MTRKTICNLLVSVLSLALLIGFACADDESTDTHRPPKTVLDYYLLLPSKYFAEEAEVNRTREERLRWLHQSPSVVDIPNGHLHMAGDGAQQSLTICLFKRPDNTYLVAVCDNDREVFDPFLDFYQYTNGRWINVTKSVLPVRYNRTLDYVLPRHGTTIKVFDGKERSVGTGKKLYDLVWSHSKFIVR